jgi:hypothetical protein
MALSLFSNNIGGNEDLTNATRSNPPATGMRNGNNSQSLLDGQNPASENASGGATLWGDGTMFKDEAAYNSFVDDKKAQYQGQMTQNSATNLASPNIKATGSTMDVSQQTGDISAGVQEQDAGTEYTSLMDNFEFSEPEQVEKTNIEDLIGYDKMQEASQYYEDILNGNNPLAAEQNQAMQDLQAMQGAQSQSQVQQLAQQGISGNGVIVFQMMQNRGFGANRSSMLAKFASDISNQKANAAQLLADIGLKEMGMEMEAAKFDEEKQQYQDTYAMNKDKMMLQGEQFDEGMKLQWEQFGLQKTQAEIEADAANAAAWAADLQMYDPTIPSELQALKDSFEEKFPGKTFPGNIVDVAFDTAFNGAIADGMEYMTLLPAEIDEFGQSYKDKWINGEWKNDDKFVNDAEKAFKLAHNGEEVGDYDQSYVDSWISETFIPMIDKTPESETIATLQQMLMNQPNWEDVADQQKALDDVEMFVKLGGQKLAVTNDGFAILDSEGKPIYTSGSSYLGTSGFSGNYESFNLSDDGKSGSGTVKTEAGYNTAAVKITESTKLLTGRALAGASKQARRAIAEYTVDGKVDIKALKEADPEAYKYAILSGQYVPPEGLNFTYDPKNNTWTNVETGKTWDERTKQYHMIDGMNTAPKPTPKDYLEDGEFYANEDGELMIVNEGTEKPLNFETDILTLNPSDKDSSKYLDIYNNIDEYNMSDEQKRDFKFRIESLAAEELAGGGLTSDVAKYYYDSFKETMGLEGYKKFLVDVFDGKDIPAVTADTGHEQVGTGGSARIVFKPLEGLVKGSVVNYFGRPTMIAKAQENIDHGIAGDSETVYHLTDMITGQTYSIRTNNYVDNSVSHPSAKNATVFIPRDDGTAWYTDKDLSKTVLLSKEDIENGTYSYKSAINDKTIDAKINIDGGWLSE